MDPYVYPGTNVLRSLRDIRDADQLNKFEAIATTRRIVDLEHGELEHEPIQGLFEIDAGAGATPPGDPPPYFSFFRTCTNGPETFGL
jgi:hypothetical protein